MPLGEARIQCDGWTLIYPSRLSELPAKPGRELIERALQAARGEAGDPLRRSRHASTYKLRIGQPRREVEIFVKVLDAPRAIKRLLRPITGSRAERLLKIADSLEATGFAIAPILMLGEHNSDGRTMIVMACVAGEPLPRHLLGLVRAPERKRAVLRELGVEVARLHRTGFIHGDLTPYNVFVAGGGSATARFVLIDHERTKRPRLVWQRRKLRNLVQLCRFELKGMSRTDRVRVVDAYASASDGERRRLVRRVASMLRARRIRDGVADAGDPLWHGSRGNPV
jgi:RIO-like serine/threonine protein kinase